MKPLERDLVDLVEAEPWRLEDGMVVVGRERHIGEVRADLLLRDRHGSPVIAEFKRDTFDRTAVGQLLDYIGRVAALHPDIRGFAVAARIPPSLRAALDHHGLEWREIALEKTDEGEEPTVFSEPDPRRTPMRSASQPRSRDRLPLPEIIATEPQEVWLVPANEAYSTYQQAGIYCCPVTMRNLSGTLPDRMAFYAQGVKREVALIRDVIDIPVADVDQYAETIEAAGLDPTRIARALAAWSAWGATRGGHDYGEARVALLSKPSDADTLILPKALAGASGAGKGHQSCLAFRLADMERATSFLELRELRKGYSSADH